ncbi:MAG: hypothetical protein CMK07_13695 [Ponticaulis sp.]|nr:hypothetical protein [Ponticaulis sp.]
MQRQKRDLKAVQMGMCLLAMGSLPSCQTHGHSSPVEESKAPTGPDNPSPDSVPACANKGYTPEEYAKAVKAYLARREAEREANKDKPPEPVVPPDEPRQLRDDAMPKHECFKQLAARGDIDLLFVGDSITDFFGRSDRGQAIWLNYYGDMKAANFGISGDRTQDLLWRFEDGELDGFAAKVIVLMIGTNNIGRNETSEIPGGIEAIVREIRERQPQAKLLLLGIFPRGGPEDDGRIAVNEINAEIAGLEDGEHVFFKDIGDVFLDDNGEQIPEAWADPVHPATPGYKLWAEAIDADIQRLMRMAE